MQATEAHHLRSTRYMDLHCCVRSNLCRIALSDFQPSELGTDSYEYRDHNCSFMIPCRSAQHQSLSLQKIREGSLWLCAIYAIYPPLAAGTQCRCSRAGPSNGPSRRPPSWPSKCMLAVAVYSSSLQCFITSKLLCSRSSQDRKPRQVLSHRLAAPPRSADAQNREVLEIEV